MAVLRIPEQGRMLSAKNDIVEHLSSIGIEYEVWEPAHPTRSDASQEEILAAYSKEIDKLKARGGYVTADVINVTPQTPGLDVMLAKASIHGVPIAMLDGWTLAYARVTSHLVRRRYA